MGIGCNFVILFILRIHSIVTQKVRKYRALKKVCFWKSRILAYWWTSHIIFGVLQGKEMG